MAFSHSGRDKPCPYSYFVTAVPLKLRYPLLLDGAIILPAVKLSLEDML